MSERWLPAVGYEGIYEVSDTGRVKSLRRLDSRGRRVRGRIRALTTHPSGHLNVNLSKGDRGRTEKVHRLVLFAFAGAPTMGGMEALHVDGNPGNNRFDNLRWGTRSENVQDRVTHGTHHQAVKTHCPHGHSYDTKNTHVTSDGRRMCRECLRIRNRERREKLARILNGHE